MELSNIHAESRKEIGTAKVKKLKREGYVPGIFYSNGQSEPITIEEHTLRNFLDKNGDDAVFDVFLNNNPIKVKVQEVQRNPVTLDIHHIDLMMWNEGEPEKKVIQ